MGALEKRVRTCRLLEKMRRDPAYCETLMLRDVSFCRETAARADARKSEKPRRPAKACSG